MQMTVYHKIIFQVSEGLRYSQEQEQGAAHQQMGATAKRKTGSGNSRRKGTFKRQQRKNFQSRHINQVGTSASPLFITMTPHSAWQPRMAAFTIMFLGVLMERFLFCNTWLRCYNSSSWALHNRSGRTSGKTKRPSLQCLIPQETSLDR